MDYCRGEWPNYSTDVGLIAILHSSGGAVIEVGVGRP